MVQREVKDVESIAIVKKQITLSRKIPLFSSLEELEETDELKKDEYLAVAQSYNEIALWEEATWEEKQLLCPIINVYYDFNNAPVLVLPKFEPLCSEKEANYYEESEVIEEYHRRLGLKGYDDYNIGKFLERVYQFCENHDLDSADVIENLSNVGWHPLFGCRVIDYGLSDTIFYHYTHWGEENV